MKKRGGRLCDVERPTDNRAGAGIIVVYSAGAGKTFSTLLNALCGLLVVMVIVVEADAAARVCACATSLPTLAACFRTTTRTDLDCVCVLALDGRRSTLRSAYR